MMIIIRIYIIKPHKHMVCSLLALYIWIRYMKSYTWVFQLESNYRRKTRLSLESENLIGKRISNYKKLTTKGKISLGWGRIPKVGRSLEDPSPSHPGWESELAKGVDVTTDGGGSSRECHQSASQSRWAEGCPLARRQNCLEGAQPWVFCKPLAAVPSEQNKKHPEPGRESLPFRRLCFVPALQRPLPTNPKIVPKDQEAIFIV